MLVTGCGAMGRLGLVRAKYGGTSQSDSRYLAVGGHTAVKSRLLSRAVDVLGETSKDHPHQTRSPLQVRALSLAGSQLAAAAVGLNFRSPQRALSARSKEDKIGFDSSSPGSDGIRFDENPPRCLSRRRDLTSTPDLKIRIKVASPLGFFL